MPRIKGINAAGGPRIVSRCDLYQDKREPYPGTGECYFHR